MLLNSEHYSFNPAIGEAFAELPYPYTDIDGTPIPDAQTAYEDFFNQWGTHYIQDVTVGGRMQISCFVTETQLQTWKSKGVDVKAGMSVAFKIQLGFEVSQSQSNSDYQEMSKSSLDIKIFSYGGVGHGNDFSAWAQSVASKPMPIAVTLVPLYKLLSDVNYTDSDNRTEAMKEALRYHIYESIPFDNYLRIENTNLFDNLYRNDGSPANSHIELRRPFSDVGLQSFGDSTYHYDTWPVVVEVEYETDTSNATVIARDYNSPLLRQPIDFAHIYSDTHSGASMDGSFWSPVCPSGYYSLGDINQASHDRPSLETGLCIAERCTVPCSAGTQLWSDSGSQAYQDVSIWKTGTNPQGRSINGFISTSNYNYPTQPVFCLDETCLSPPFGGISLNDVDV